MHLSNSESKKIAMKVSKTTIIINLILFILKLFAGIFAKSGAMVSDAIHTASDVFSTFIVIIGVHISHKKPDSTHQYGHERLESVAVHYTFSYISCYRNVYWIKWNRKNIWWKLW